METLVAAPCRECSIYALCDPHTGEVRYVGKSDDPARRFRQHLEPGQLNRYKSRKNSWIKGLLTQGFEPILDILDVVPSDQADHAEQEYIGLWRYLVGDRLLNGTDGGDGGAITDPEAKARIRAAHLGAKASTETRARMSASALRRCADPKERARLASIGNGKPPVLTGVKNPKAKLDEDAVREMRRLHTGGMTGVELALKFNVTPANVSFIVRRITWQHVT